MVRSFLIRSYLLLPQNVQRRILYLRVALRGRLRVLRLRASLSAPEPIAKLLTRNDANWINPRTIFFETTKAPKPAQRYVSDHTLYWVDTKEIIYVTAHKFFDIHEYRGRVIGGDWDKLVTKFDELYIYKSMEQRFNKGTCWEQLPYYYDALYHIEKRIPVWGCKCKADLDRRCQILDRVFEDIRLNGYKTQAQIQTEKSVILDLEDEITVNVGRYGDLLFSNGRHRLAFSKIAGVDKIPVKITVRHIEWEAFKQEVELYARRNNGKVYAPLTHIDLQSIPSIHSDRRFEIINSVVGPGNNRTLLDIGVHWGYFCHKFEDVGFRCFAIEVDAENIYFLRRLKRAGNKNFAVISKSIFDLSEDRLFNYDVILALSVFHHFLKTEKTFKELKRFLAAVHVNEMYFEPHMQDDPQMKGAFVDFSPEEFVEFIIENSCLNCHKTIGESESGRQIYKLWR